MVTGTFLATTGADKGRNWLSVIDHTYDKATSVCGEAHCSLSGSFPIGLKIEETDLGKWITA